MTADDPVAGVIARKDDVVARPAVEVILAGPAVEPVRAYAAEQPVVAARRRGSRRSRLDRRAPRWPCARRSSRRPPCPRTWSSPAQARPCRARRGRTRAATDCRAGARRRAGRASSCATPDRRRGSRAPPGRRPGRRAPPRASRRRRTCTGGCARRSRWEPPRRCRPAPADARSRGGCATAACRRRGAAGGSCPPPRGPRLRRVRRTSGRGRRFRPACRSCPARRAVRRSGSMSGSRIDSS